SPRLSSTIQSEEDAMLTRAVEDGRTDVGATPRGQLPDGGAGVGGEDTGRTARKRRAIMEAATALFLCDGYRYTSMDQIAAGGGLPKQTAYKKSAEKEQLSRDMVPGVPTTPGAITPDIPPALHSPDFASHAQLRAAPPALARRYIDGVLQPH